MFASDLRHHRWMTESQQIDAFLEGRPFAVVGASTSRAKYGNKVLRNYVQRQLPVFPVNPRATEVEGLAAYPTLSALPQAIHGISIITPPDITELIVSEALQLGIQHFWMQPGAESQKSVELALGAGANVIYGGACLLVVLRFRENS